MKLIVLDEISVYKVDTLWEISERLKGALLAQTRDPARISYIKATPFGGIHIIFTGDLYQLPPVCGSGLAVYDSGFKREREAQAGKELWLSVTKFFELTTKKRFDVDTQSAYPEFLSEIRSGQVDADKLAEVNTRVCTEEECKILAHPKALWLAPSRKQVAGFNDSCFAKIKSSGVPNLRIISHHLFASGQLNIRKNTPLVSWTRF
jgi:hypothetical protein